MIKQIVFTEEEYEEIKRKLKDQSDELQKLENEIEDFKRRVKRFFITMSFFTVKPVHITQTTFS